MEEQDRMQRNYERWLSNEDGKEELQAECMIFHHYHHLNNKTFQAQPPRVRFKQYLHFLERSTARRASTTIYHRSNIKNASEGKKGGPFTSSDHPRQPEKQVATSSGQSGAKIPEKGEQGESSKLGGSLPTEVLGEILASVSTRRRRIVKLLPTSRAIAMLLTSQIQKLQEKRRMAGQTPLQLIGERYMSAHPGNRLVEAVFEDLEQLANVHQTADAFEWVDEEAFVFRFTDDGEQHLADAANELAQLNGEPENYFGNLVRYQLRVLLDAYGGTSFMFGYNGTIALRANHPTGPVASAHQAGGTETESKNEAILNLPFLHCPQMRQMLIDKHGASNCISLKIPGYSFILVY